MIDNFNKIFGLFCIFIGFLPINTYGNKDHQLPDTLYHSIEYYPGTNQVKREVLACDESTRNFINIYYENGTIKAHFFLYKLDTIVSFDSIGKFDVFQLVLTYSGFEYTRHGKINGFKKVEKGYTIESYKNLIFRPRKRKFLKGSILIAA